MVGIVAGDGAPRFLSDGCSSGVRWTRPVSFSDSFFWGAPFLLAAVVSPCSLMACFCGSWLCFAVLAGLLPQLTTCDHRLTLIYIPVSSQVQYKMPANFQQVKRLSLLVANSCQSFTFKHDCAVSPHPWNRVPSPSDGWHACSRRCQLALDLTIRGTGYITTPLHSLGDCIEVGVFLLIVRFSLSLLSRNMIILKVTLRLYSLCSLTEGRPPGQRPSLSHAASSKKKRRFSDRQSLGARTAPAPKKKRRYVYSTCIAKIWMWIVWKHGCSEDGFLLLLLWRRSCFAEICPRFGICGCFWLWPFPNVFIDTFSTAQLHVIPEELVAYLHNAEYSHGGNLSTGIQQRTAKAAGPAFVDGGQSKVGGASWPNVRQSTHWEIPRRFGCPALWQGCQTQPHRPLWWEEVSWGWNQRGPKMVEDMSRLDGTLQNSQWTVYLWHQEVVEGAIWQGNSSTVRSWCIHGELREEVAD